MGCSSSKALNTEVQCSQIEGSPADLSIPLQLHPRLYENTHFVFLTSSTYGIMKDTYPKPSGELQSSLMCRIGIKQQAEGEAADPLCDATGMFDANGVKASDIKGLSSELRLDPVDVMLFKSRLKRPEVINTWDLMAGLESEESSSTGSSASSPFDLEDGKRSRSLPSAHFYGTSDSRPSQNGGGLQDIFHFGRLPRAEVSLSSTDGESSGSVTEAGCSDTGRYSAEISSETLGSEVSSKHGSISPQCNSTVMDVSMPTKGSTADASRGSANLNQGVVGRGSEGEKLKKQVVGSGLDGEGWEAELVAELEKAGEETGGGGRIGAEEGEAVAKGGSGVVLYTTSLRGVKSTFEECRTVKAILEGYGVWVDERDVAMDVGYLREAQSLQTPWQRELRRPAVPRLLVRGLDIGSADAVVRLNEQGRLLHLLGGIAHSSSACRCAACDGVRFIPCSACNGSRKFFLSATNYAIICPHCNENGLSRCPLCCATAGPA